VFIDKRKKNPITKLLKR